MKAVILDMYGVIMKDPEGGLMPFVNRTFPALSREDIYKYWNKGDIGELSSLDFFKSLGYQKNLNEIEKKYLETIEIDESFYAFAQTIKKHYKLGLLSNDLGEWSKYLRDKYKINDYFDVITVSGDVRIRKPDERIFANTIDKLGLAPSACIYVDDRRYNLEAAAALGMSPILFNTRKVQYDGKTVYNFKELADMLIPSNLTIPEV